MSRLGNTQREGWPRESPTTCPNQFLYTHKCASILKSRLTHSMAATFLEAHTSVIFCRILRRIESNMSLLGSHTLRGGRPREASRLARAACTRSVVSFPSKASKAIRPKWLSWICSKCPKLLMKYLKENSKFGL